MNDNSKNICITYEYKNKKLELELRQELVKTLLMK